MVCCVTGHRPGGFPFPPEDRESLLEYKRRLYAEVKELIDGGCRHFITGMAEGVDTDFAIAVMFYKKEHKDIFLEAALPYPVPRRPFGSAMSLKEHLLSECDCVTVVSDSYFDGCMQKRNCYMVDRADIVLAVWNGERKGGTWNTISYARRSKKPVHYIMLNEFDQRRLF
jgi:uncharacterized phage-like protein YoqJ